MLLGDDTDPTISQVVVDDPAGAYAATKHLLGLGHKRILFFVHHTIKPHCSIAERLGGYRAAMDEAGLEPRECVHVPEEDAIDILVRGTDRPTGIVCYSNLEATLIVHAMWQYGVSIPADLSIVGFNDVFATRYMTPPLTTVGFDAAKIGELGAQLIASRHRNSARGAEACGDDGKTEVDRSWFNRTGGRASCTSNSLS